MKGINPSIGILCLMLISQTITAANRYWVASTSSNWNNTANWSSSSGGAGGSTVPGASDAVIFNGLGLGNCTLDAAINISSINVNAAYTGTILQGTQTIIISSTSTFSGGTFTGGSGNITFVGNCTLNGTLFTSTSSILEFNGNSTLSGGSFVHNNGTAKYNYTGGSSQSISGTGLYVFNILEFVGTAHTISLPANNVTVNGALNFTGSSNYTLNSGTIDVTGDINLNNTAVGCAGSAQININGTGIQNLNGNAIAGSSALPKLTIDKSAGTLNLNNFISVSAHFTYTAGTVNEGTSTVCFTDGTVSPNNITGNFTFNNLQFIASANQTFKIASTTILIVNGNFTMSGTSNITLNTGNINIKGNVYLNNTASGGGGTSVINIIGTGNQLIDGSAITAMQNRLPYIIVNKSNGTLSLKGNISVSQDWTYTSGVVDAITWSSNVFFGGNNLNVNSAGMSFYNLEVSANTSTLTSNLTVAGNITMSGTGILSAGSNTINVAGNWIGRGTTGFTEGTGSVVLNGSTLQTITSAGGENFSSLTINNSSSGIRLINSIVVSGTLNMTQGNVDLNGNSITLGLSVATNGTLSRSTGIMYGLGSFTRWFKTLTIPDGSITGLFPMGTAVDYRPFFVSAPATAPTAGGTITVTYTDAATNTSISIPDGIFTVLLRKDLNWNVSTANGLSGGTYNLRVDGTSLGSVSNVTDLRLTLLSSVVGSSGTNGGTVSNPQIKRTGLSTTNLTNNFYVGTINPSNSSLPLTFTSFTARTIGDKVELAWKMASDVSSNYFVVQRSTDYIHWNNIRSILSNSLPASSDFYKVMDENPIKGQKNLYRIKEVGIDSNNIYSPVKSVNLLNINLELSIYPNPTNGFLNIVTSIVDKYEVSLISENGQVLLSDTFTGETHKLNLAQVRGGLYYIIIRSKRMVTTQGISIIR